MKEKRKDQRRIPFWSGTVLGGAMLLGGCYSGGQVSPFAFESRMRREECELVVRPEAEAFARAGDAVVRVSLINRGGRTVSFVSRPWYWSCRYELRREGGGGGAVALSREAKLQIANAGTPVSVVRQDVAGGSRWDDEVTVGRLFDVTGPGRYVLRVEQRVRVDGADRRVAAEPVVIAIAR